MPALQCFFPPRAARPRTFDNARGLFYQPALMPEIHLGRGRDRLGLFTDDEVLDGLRAGRFFLSDLGWREDMADWRRLADFPEFSTAGAMAPSLPLPLEPDAAAPADEWPWAERKTRGLLRAFFATARLVLRSPRAAFSAMPRDEDPGASGAALLFAFLGVAAASLLLLVSGSVMLLMMAAAPGAASAAHAPQPLPGVSGDALILVLAIGWPMLTCALFLGFIVATAAWAALIHLCLKIANCAREPFAATFRVLCYAGGATAFLLAVPFIGIFLSLIANLLAVTAGLSAVHGQPLGRVMLAMLLPALALVAGVLLFAAALAALTHAASALPPGGLV